MYHSILTFFRNFIKCGLTGWCLECFFTGLDACMKRKDKCLFCRTSIWMFPIYGMAALFAPIGKCIRNKCLLFRGSVYALLIFLGEFIFGLLLKKHNACPWDYSHAKLNYKGIVRLDYAPAWFFVGLLFERLVCGKRKTACHRKGRITTH